MNRRHVVFVAVFLLSFLFCFSERVAAKDTVALSLNQSDFYFPIGQTAVVPLTTSNDYGKEQSGMLTYTLAQEINQGNFHYTNTDSRSQSFTIPDGTTVVTLGFGSSNTPTTIQTTLQFVYTDGTQKTVSLGPFRIHFVPDPTQQQSQQQQQMSSSTQEQQSKAAQEEQQRQEEEKKRQESESLEEQKRKQLEQNLQNNQMSQDSAALQSQIQKERQQKQTETQQFAEMLGKNPAIQQAHASLQSQGYQITNQQIESATNTSGKFLLNYTRGNESAFLEGSMTNGTIDTLYRESAEDRARLLAQLENSTEFQSYDERLQDKKFRRQTPEFSHTKSEIIVTIPYTQGNLSNVTASIRATFVNDTFKSVFLQESTSEGQWYLWIFLLVFAVCLLGYGLYRRYQRTSGAAVVPVVPVLPEDYHAVAFQMIERAERLFHEGQAKEAYSAISQAIRYFLSRAYRLDIELTTAEMLSYLERHRIASAQFKDCFFRCDVVTFAKGKPDPDEFRAAMTLAKKTVAKK